MALDKQKFGAIPEQMQADLTQDNSKSDTLKNNADK